MSSPSQDVTAIKLRAILDRISELSEDEPADTPTAGSPVDLVAVKQRAGFNMLSVAEWQSIPTEDRKDAVIERRVVFLHCEEPVPTRSALIWLKGNA